MGLEFLKIGVVIQLIEIFQHLLVFIFDVLAEEVELLDAAIDPYELTLLHDIRGMQEL